MRFRTGAGPCGPDPLSSGIVVSFGPLIESPCRLADTAPNRGRRTATQKLNAVFFVRSLPDLGSALENALPFGGRRVDSLERRSLLTDRDDATEEHGFGRFKRGLRWRRSPRRCGPGAARGGGAVEFQKSSTFGDSGSAVRHLESHDDPGRARGLSDYLEAQGIENEVRSQDGRHEVWIIDHEDLDTAEELASQYSDAASDATRVEAQRIRTQRETDPRPVRIPGLSAGAGRAGGSPLGPATVALIVLSVAVSVLSDMGDPSSPVVRALLVVPVTIDGYYLPQIQWVQPWRLLTPMFIHFGLLHLAFNMLWLYRLGCQIERLQGMRTLLGLVALTQIPGVLAQFEMSGPIFGGMSGVVYGVFGFSWMQTRYTSKGYALSDQDTLWIMGWFVLCATGLVGRIANAQHALGLVFGLMAGMPAYLAFRRSSARPSFEKGSWVDLNIRGFQRVRRLYFDPYVPLWFVGLAVVVLLIG